ncbi:pentatricopeptide repeat-containing protein At1g05600 [Telopea speciosissima]|uniref:pentatricopeptide repeat-containing protein At1g05600 n=1 Tax=Telopea speciosissima TaxID=54955 RepID=UPI001CC4DBEE|nr:pentatricopeptide repeat-containing protein At1g05600 [Telopea speciosissima]
MRWPGFLTPTHLSQLLQKQKNPLTAFRIFNEAKSRYPDYRHNGPVYSTMIDILGSSGRFSEMKELIEQMKDDSCESKDSVLANAIKTYAKAKLLDEAISLFRNLPQFNCVNWTKSFNTILEVLLNEAKFETAHRIYLENSNRWEVKTYIRSFNLFIDALCRRNRSDLALQIFQEMSDQSCYPDRETYRLLMRGLCDDGRLNEAVHLLYSMLWRISQRGCGEDVSVYITLLHALCDNGQVEAALEILAKVLRKGLKAPKRSLQGLDLNRCLEDENPERIKGLISEALIRGGIPSSASYSAIASDLYSEGKICDANKVFDEMRESGFLPSVSMYEAKISALGNARRAEEAVKVIEKDMVEGNCVPSVTTYNIVMKGLCNEGQPLMAVGYLEKMSKQVGCRANKESYSILMDGLCQEGQYSEGSRILERMLDRGFWPCDATYNRLIRGLCLVGKRYDAVLWLEEMVSRGKSPKIAVWESLVIAVCSDMVEAGASVVDTLQQLTKSEEDFEADRPCLHI